MHIGSGWRIAFTAPKPLRAIGGFSRALTLKLEGHPDERPVKLAMEELHFFSSEVTVLGTYPASTFRAELKASQD